MSFLAKSSHRCSVISFLVAETLLFVAAAVAEDVPRLTIATKRFGGVQIMSVGIDGSHPVQITRETEEATQPMWSPDGSKLVYLVGPRQKGTIKICDADGGNAHHLFEGEGPQKSPRWSPDGKRIAFSMQSLATNNNHIFVIGADGKNLKNLTPAVSYAACPAWSPDGSKIACSSKRPSGRLGLFVMKDDGSDLVDVAGRDIYAWVYPCWSPDGKQLAFGYSEGPERSEIWQINADGTGESPLILGPSSYGFAAWSPDGRYLAFASGPISDAGDLCVYDVLSGEHRVVLHNEAYEMPHQDGPPSWVPLPRKEKER